jgi:HSP20 family protein
MAKAKESKETRATEGRQQGGQSLQPGGQPQQTGLTRRGGEGTLSPFDSPFGLMRRFREEMDRLFDDFGLGGGLFPRGFGRDILPRGFGEIERSIWSPQVEAFERGGKFIVRADLPGLTKDDVKVEVTDDAIIIEGERRSEQEESREGFYRSERSYGTFRRQIPLPEGVNAEDADATFRNGVLEITMQAPQREERPTRQIQIKDSPEGEGQTRAKAAGRGK